MGVWNMHEVKYTWISRGNTGIDILHFETLRFCHPSPYLEIARNTRLDRLQLLHQLVPHAILSFLAYVAQHQCAGRSDLAVVQVLAMRLRPLACSMHQR